MPAYNTYYGTTKTTWYTDSRVQAHYQAYIKAVVSHYSSSTAIFAWELANEPRCNGCATSIVTNWATTTSVYIKSLDSSHMVTMGDEGFMNGGDGSYPYTTGEGMDFAANFKIPVSNLVLVDRLMLTPKKDISFGTFHLYPSGCIISPRLLKYDTNCFLGGETNDWGNSWIANHGSVCASIGKPCILEEYGVTSSKASVEGAWQTTALGTNGTAGDMFLQYGDTLSTGQTTDDGYTIFYGTSDYTSSVTNHVAAIGGATSSGGGTTIKTSAASTTTTASSGGGTLAKWSNVQMRVDRKWDLCCGYYVYVFQRLVLAVLVRIVAVDYFSGRCDVEAEGNWHCS